MCDLQVMAAIGVFTQNIGDICGIAPQMHIVASGLTDERSGGPHADAPAVTVILADLRVPLECLLTSDLPEIPMRTPRQWISVGAKQRRANPVRPVMVALVVTVSAALAWAHGNITCQGASA